MGLQIERDRFEPEEYERFAERLERSLVALRQLLARPGFGEGTPSLGAELELSLVDEAARPLPLNEAVIDQTLDPRVTVELDRFNLECNLRYSTLAGRPFSALEREIESALVRVADVAARHAGRVALVGILPTLRNSDLASSAMTDTPRFRALNAALQNARGGPFRLHIDGADPLEMFCNDVTVEGAATSWQLHLRVAPSAFAAVFDAIQLATAPVLAISGNSPIFLGHRLWEETRVALFKQAVDDRGPLPSDGQRREPRVSFGRGWMQEGAYELFAEAVALHRVLLPVLGDQDPLAALERGDVPRLDEVRLHQGTVWSWNRPIYDPADGGHLRIEMRALPSGPTPRDMLANSAFLIGLAHGLVPDIDSVREQLPFERAHHNFYRAAQQGLEAELDWPIDGRLASLPARELIPHLLPLAERGLAHAGVAPDEAARHLSIIAERCASGQTGARWQRAALFAVSEQRDRQTALVDMLERYLEHSHTGEPVHTWPVPSASPRARVSSRLHERSLDASARSALPVDDADFLRELGGPAILHIPGVDRSRTRAVSCLLHGNEPSGLRAVHRWLRAGGVPAVDVLFFVGAVEAALAGGGFAHRFLPGGRDLNRSWLAPFTGPEGALARDALARIRQPRVESLIDLHNNTGHNPPYGVAVDLEPATLDLVSLFAARTVHSPLRLGTLVEATADAFPSVTIECGRSGDPSADAIALAGLERYLALERIEHDQRVAPEMAVLEDPVRVEVCDGLEIAFGSEPAAGVDLTVDREIDRHNFERLPAGIPIGWLGERRVWPIEARGADGADRSRELFAARGDAIETRRPIVPIMMTTNRRNALNDCLFYVVRERGSE